MGMVRIDFVTPGPFTWTVPAGVNAAWLTMVGSGSGGGGVKGPGNNATQAGGSAEFLIGMLIRLVPGEMITGNVAVAGAGQHTTTPGGFGVPQGGEASVFGTFTTAGGRHSAVIAGHGSDGGGVRGGSLPGGNFNGRIGALETPKFFGGGGGGNSGGGGDAGGSGAPAAGYPIGATGPAPPGGGGGGGNLLWGPGGNGRTAHVGDSAAVNNYGAGGGGTQQDGGSNTYDGGNGAKGYISLVYIG
jgi:hypothetical protein